MSANNGTPEGGGIPIGYLFQLLAVGLSTGNALLGPMAPYIIRVRKASTTVRRHRAAAVLIAVPDELAVNLKGPENERDILLMARIRRKFYDAKAAEVSSQIVRPTIVGPDGRPMS